jgi:hypothetical protein
MIRRFAVLVASAAAGGWLWWFAPSQPGFREFDRAVFSGVMQACANPPLIVSGEGTYASPWTLRTLTTVPSKRATDSPAPVVVAIGDDPEGVFQSSPPSPVDYAVMLKNLRRLGAKRVALGTVMAWGESDPIARAALERQLSDFETAVTATPLTRGATPEPMPGAFLRGSLPIKRVKGETALLPVVNRLPVPGTILGEGKVIAGFSELESEPATGLPLLARWGDRVVFAFPVMAALAERGLTVEDMTIRLGESLQLGPDGPIVPLDSFGRLAVSLAKSSPVAPVAAESLIDAAELPASPLVVLRDDRGAADVATKRFSAALVPALATIDSEAGLSPKRKFGRMPWQGEAMFLVGIVLLQVMLAGGGSFRRHLTLLLLTGLVVATQYTGACWAHGWLPGVAALGSVVAGWLVSWPPRERPEPSPADESGE